MFPVNPDGGILIIVGVRMTMEDSEETNLKVS